jgi:hypothetical protein
MLRPARQSDRGWTRDGRTRAKAPAERAAKVGNGPQGHRPRLVPRAWDSPCVRGFCSSRATDSVMHGCESLPFHRDLRRFGVR